MLNAIRRATAFEQKCDNLKVSRESRHTSRHIRVVVGYPSETIDMLKQTIDFIRRTGPDCACMHEVIPYLGTEPHNLIRELGWEMLSELC